MEYHSRIVDTEWLTEPDVFDIQTFLATARQDLIRDVGMIFNSDTNALPSWLFSDNEAHFHKTKLDKNDPQSIPCDAVNYNHGLGNLFPTFLRQIGRTNAATVRHVVLMLYDLLRGIHYFAIYAEILKQHVPGLRKLFIGGLY